MNNINFASRSQAVEGLGLSSAGRGQIKSDLSKEPSTFDQMVSSLEKSPDIENKNNIKNISTQNISNNNINGTNIAYKKAANQFEKEILSILWNFMFELIEVDSMFGGGIGEETFRSEIVKKMVDQLPSGRSSLYRKVYKGLVDKDKLREKNESIESQDSSGLNN